MSTSSQHPVISGALVGVIEISMTYPMEFVKRQLQLQQQASSLTQSAGVQFRGPLHCAAETVRTRGVLGLYRGFEGFVIFAGPRSGTRFASFEFFTTTAQRLGLRKTPQQRAASDFFCGLGAGAIEAILCQTPTQAITTKMMHDASPSGRGQYKGLNFFGVAAAVYREYGFVNGIYTGLSAAVLKGAATNCIRFPVFGALKSLLQEGGDRSKPLPPHLALPAGAVAGAISAVATQPFDTLMACMQGMESAKYRNVVHCARELIAAGGVRTLYNGLTPRVVRVMCEVGLLFGLFEQVSPFVDRLLG